jgi:curved DNA-binding protein CbpA
VSNNLRSELRQESDCAVELTWKTETGEKRSGADNETIERVYRTLTRRFHLDNEKTGAAAIFLRIAEAHRILTDPKQRERYDHERDDSKAIVRFDLRSREFFAGLRGEQNRWVHARGTRVRAVVSL